MKILIPILIGLLVVGCGKKIGDVTDCVDCGGFVALSAVSCPHCGTDFTGSKAKAAAAEAKANKTQPKTDPTPKPETEEETKNPESAPAPVVIVTIDNPIVEKAIRESLKDIGESPTGELTKADLEKVTKLYLVGEQLTEVPKGLEKLTQLTLLHFSSNQLTDVKGLEKLTQLRELSLVLNKLTDVKGLENLTQLTLLYLVFNPDLTKAQIDELQKALPKCKIEHNAK